MSMKDRLENFKSTLGPCPPIPTRELRHLDPEAFFCAALAVLDWDSQRSLEIAEYLTFEGTPYAAPGRVPEEETPQSKLSVQESGI
ncbi:MAG: hypothetical protein ABSH01_03215 [Terriglobia bacterium]|jgi:hypothetical protein